MELGLFHPIANNGWIVSENSPQYKPSWEMSKYVTQQAEKFGFDFSFSMIKMRGFGGPTEFWDWALEPFTLMAALAAVTERIRIIPSVGLLSMHPAMAARMAATIDEISGGTGRCGLNIVSGWIKSEYDQYGLWPGDDYFQSRYDYAEEYVEVLRKLWEHGRVTHEGEYFHLRDAVVQPRPKSPIQIVCAGQSERGMRFTAKMGDYNFIIGDQDTVQGINKQVKAFAKEYGREVGTYALYTVVMGDTDAEAEALNKSYVNGADKVALQNMQPSLDLDAAARGGTARAIMRDAMYIGIPTVVGSYDTVTAFFNNLFETTTIDGILLTFPDFIEDIVRFGENVLPNVDRQAAVLSHRVG
jgi:pyrimidine oxygenase